MSDESTTTKRIVSLTVKLGEKTLAHAEGEPYAAFLTVANLTSKASPADVKYCGDAILAYTGACKANKVEPADVIVNVRSENTTEKGVSVMSLTIPLTVWGVILAAYPKIALERYSTSPRGRKAADKPAVTLPELTFA